MKQNHPPRGSKLPWILCGISMAVCILCVVFVVLFIAKQSSSPVSTAQIDQNDQASSISDQANASVAEQANTSVAAQSDATPPVVENSTADSSSTNWWETFDPEESQRKAIIKARQNPSTVSSCEYVGNISTEVYHVMGCRYYPSWVKQVFFETKESAESLGFTPCPDCIK